MRTVLIPDNIQLVDPLTDAPGDFVAWKRWFLTCVVNDQRMGTTPLQLAMVVRLVEKVKALAPGKTLELDDEEFDATKPIVEAPQLAMGGPLVMAQLVGFTRAFLDAQRG